MKKIVGYILKSLLFIARILAAVLILYFAFNISNKWNYIFDRFDTQMRWNDDVGFEGRGTAENPYLIQSTDDFILFADSVNNGGLFTSAYFLQTVDVDLEDVENFEPIGSLTSGYSFRGIYNGGGHKIYNLNIDGDELENNNVALFGVLEGTVMNLGIESGNIRGECAAGIAYTAGYEGALIINCYNNARIHGEIRWGGIADSFYYGKIINCANFGRLSCGDICSQICSFDCGEVIACCNLDSSRHPMLNYESISGRVYDCYVGHGDFEEMNARHESVSSYLPEGVELVNW